MIDLTPQDSETWATPLPHTPTPWSEFAENGDWWIQGKDAEGNPIGHPVCDANDMSTADMLFIIQAVNNLDALVGALQQAQEDTCSMHCPSVKRTGTPWTHSAKCTAISAVLKLAKGE